MSQSLNHGTYEELRRWSPVFIETGTGRGAGVIGAWKEGFTRILSCEFFAPGYHEAKKEIERLGVRAELFLGDSSDHLAMMLDLCKESSAVVFLDAHHVVNMPCEPIQNGKTWMRCPLRNELVALAQAQRRDNLILVDDVDFLGREEMDGISLEELKRIVLSINPNYSFEIRDGARFNSLLICRPICSSEIPEDEIHTHIETGMGDTVIHLHFLRKMARAYPKLKFIHAYGVDYSDQYREFLNGEENIKLIPLRERNQASINCWYAARPDPQRRLGKRPIKNKTWPPGWVGMYLFYFERIAAEMGLECAVNSPLDMLFDEPPILYGETGELGEKLDFLIVNNPPCSWQFDPAKADRFYLDPLIAELAAVGHRLVCTSATKVHGVPVTQERKISVCGIGTISLKARNILMISCGASWLTFNVWNRETPRIIFSLRDIVELPGNMITVGNWQEARTLLRQRGELK